MSRYNITVVLHNAGTKKSDETIVNLTDEEMLTDEGKPIPLEKTVYVEAGNNTIVIFEWATARYKNQNITVGFYPADPQGLPDSYNSGSKSFTLLVVNTENKKTPGFPFALFVLAGAIIIFLKHYKR